MATVSQKALRLGLKKKETMRWTNKELVILKRMYGKTTALQIAQKLGRSAQSVRQKAHRMGLKAYRDHKVTSVVAVG